MKTLLAALSLSLFALSASAAPPTDESIRTLFTVMKTEASLDQFYAVFEPAMVQGLVQTAAGKELTPEKKSIFDRYFLRVSELMRTEMSWAKLEPMHIKIYRESFDQAEIDGLIAFYGSPIGQSFASKMPVVTQKAMAEIQPYMQQLMPKIKTATQEMAKEIKMAESKSAK